MRRFLSGCYLFVPRSVIPPREERKDEFRARRCFKNRLISDSLRVAVKIERKFDTRDEYYKNETLGERRIVFLSNNYFSRFTQLYYLFHLHLIRVYSIRDLIRIPLRI